MLKYIRNLSVFTALTTLAACADSGGGMVDVEDIKVADPAPVISQPTNNIFDNDYFKEQNVMFREQSSGNRYIDDALGDFEVLDLGTYTSETNQALSVCVSMIAGDSFPALRLVGKNPKFTLTSMLNVRSGEVILDESGMAGTSNYNGDGLCLTSQSLPAGSTVKAAFFPAMSRVENKYQKNATGAVAINDVSVSWVDL